MNAAARYRRTEAIVIAGLTALVCACAILGPVLQRAIEQSVLNTVLTTEHPPQTGLVVTESSATPLDVPPPDPATIDALLPASVRSLLTRPVEQVGVSVSLLTKQRPTPAGRLIYRAGMCQHVRIVSGRCPTAAREVLVSAADATAHGWTPGASFAVADHGSGLSLTVSVVGSYVQEPDPYWAGTVLSLSGATSTDPVIDALLTPRQTIVEGALTSSRARGYLQSDTALTYAVRPGEVRVDDFLAATAELSAFLTNPRGSSQPDPSDPVARVTVIAAYSGLTDIAGDLRIERHQSRTTVAVIVGQVVFLLLCVLWLVLVALTEQRRPEIAVARLRGRSPALTRTLLLAETVPIVVAGALAGVLLALVGSYAARRLWLGGSPGFSVGSADGWALAGALVVVLVLTSLSVLRPSRQPVASLLRSVPPRVHGAAVGTVEAVVVAVGATAYVAVLTGQVSGPVALAVPALLAASLGIVAAKVVAPILALLGRRALRRGRPVAAVGHLEASRRPTARWLLPITSLATASLVFGVNAAAVGERNQNLAGRFDTGAAVVAQVGATDARALVAALRVADPSGLAATPVVSVAPQLAGSPTTVAVLPASFRQVASVADRDRGLAGWAALATAVPPTAQLSGRTFTGTVTTRDVHGPAGTTYDLGLELLAGDGTQVRVTLGDFPLDHATTTKLSLYVPCDGGCQLQAVDVLTPSTAPDLRAVVALSDLAVDGRPADLGTAATWAPIDLAPATFGVTMADPHDLVLTIANAGASPFGLRAAALGGATVALATPAALSTQNQGKVLATDTGDHNLLVTPVGTISVVPGAPLSAVLVDLSRQLNALTRLSANTTAYVYFARDDPALINRTAAVLTGRGIPVISTTTAASRTAVYRSSAAALSLSLAIATALLALLVAVLGLVVLVANSRRGRTWDLASLRLAGVRPASVRAMAIREIVPLTALGVLVGLGAGLVGSVTTLRLVPLFTRPPTTMQVDLGLALPPLVVAVVIALLALVGAATAMAMWTVRRTSLERLREPS
ncbi:MAG: ABC transporter permease [Nostocoides sp.]